MDEVRKSTNRFSESSFQAITQLENVLQELNGTIQKKRSPKKGLFSQFKRPKLDDYRRSIIERALQGPSPSNHSIKKTTSQFISTSTPMTKLFNNKKCHLADNRNSSFLISPIAKTSSKSPSPYDNIILENTSKSKSENYLEKSSQNFSKSNHNSKRSVLNELLTLQMHDEQSINRNESISNSNKSNKLQNREQLNKSANNSKLNNNTKTRSTDELSISVRADVEQLLKDLDNSILNETSSIIIKKPWCVNKSFALSATTFDSLERNLLLVKDLDKKLPKKCHTNKKRFVNKKSLSYVNKNTQESSEDCNEQNPSQIAIFEDFINKSDDNDLDKSDSDVSDSDLECVRAFLSSVVNPTASISVRFCDDDDDDDDGDVDENVNNKNTTKKVLRSYNKKKDEEQASTSNTSTLKQNTFQKFNELQISTGLENSDDSEDGIVYANHAKRTKTTKQTSIKAKKTTRNNNNVNKMCSLISETSCFNTNQTQETPAGIRRSSRARKQVQFRGTVVITDSVRLYKKINQTAAQSEKKRKTI